mmetsp:Transcript_21875/g.41167  ORF Transcript_21875/g.41167 Transcript_21875/m.41167 type:complete len:124 (+) Transcript_21875:680-1051(+)
MLPDVDSGGDSGGGGDGGGRLFEVGAQIINLCKSFKQPVLDLLACKMLPVRNVQRIRKLRIQRINMGPESTILRLKISTNDGANRRRSRRVQRSIDLLGRIAGNFSVSLRSLDLSVDPGQQTF